MAAKWLSSSVVILGSTEPNGAGLCMLINPSRAVTHRRLVVFHRNNHFLLGLPLCIVLVSENDYLLRYYGCLRETMLDLA